MPSDCHRTNQTAVYSYIRNIYDIRVGIESKLARRAVELASDEGVWEIRAMHEDLNGLIRLAKPMVDSRENSASGMP